MMTFTASFFNSLPKGGSAKDFEAAFRASFSADVCRSRNAKGMVQLALAEAADISLRQLQNIENGKCIPKAYTFLRLLYVLDLDPNKYKDLFRRLAEQDRE